MTAALGAWCPSLCLGTFGIAPLGVGGVLLLLGAWVLALWISRRSYESTVPGLSSGRRRFLTVLRALSLTLLLALLLEPALIRHQSESVDPTVLFLVDDSASMSIQDMGSKSRLDAARSDVDRLRRQIAERAPIVRTEVGAGSRRLRLGRFSDESEARGEGTDLRSLVVSAEQRHLDENLAAIVLLSDGRDTDGAHGPARVDVPVFAVVLGDTSGVSDLRLDRVRYPGLVRRGDRVEITAELVTEAASAGSTRVELLRGSEVVDGREMSWSPGTERHPVRFEVEADSLGWQRLRLRARALPDEVLDQNNSSQIAYEVQKDRLRILYLAQNPTWNLHFLRRFAHSDPRFDFWVATPRADGMSIASAESSLSWPPSPEELADVDLFIAGSLQDYVRLSTELDVRTAVRGGAGLWVFAAGGSGRAIPRLSPEQAGLLPLHAKGRWRISEGEYRAVLAPEGRGHALLPWNLEHGDFESRLAQMPPFDLSLGPSEPTEDATVLLRARSGPWIQPLLAVRHEGEGEVAFWTGAPFWSWSFWRLGPTDNEDVYTAMVDNLLSRLGEGGDRNRLRLRLPARVLAVGSEAMARVTALDPQFRPDDDSEIWMEWADADSSRGPDRLQRLPMDLDPDSPGGRRLALPSLPPGDYRFRARIEPVGEEPGLSSDWTPLSIDAYSIEYRNPNPDLPALRSLAEHSGGRLLHGSQDPDWIDSLDLSPQRHAELLRFDLWSSWWAFGALLLLLGMEWGCRRRWGLL
jgi:hypothetical protein